MELVPCARLSIFVKQCDQWHRKPLYAEIVQRARRAHLAGATVLNGVEGYGRSRRIYTSRILSLTSDLPVVVVLVDTYERIRAFLDTLHDIEHLAVAVVDAVEVTR